MHDWIVVEGKIATIGITDYAQKELGEVMYVELPQLGFHVHEGEEVVVIESTKAAVDIYAPVDGEIIEVNTILHDTPQTINQSPESKGWLYKLRLLDGNAVDSFMDRTAYTHYIVDSN